MARGRPRKTRLHGSIAGSQSATTGHEAELWAMAAALRGSMDAAEYKHVVRRLISLTGSAAAMLTRYDGMLETVPNPRVLLPLLTIREAVLSSRIEGTQATMDGVLQFQTPILPERHDDIREVLNYRAAMRRAEETSAEPADNGHEL